MFAFLSGSFYAQSSKDSSTYYFVPNTPERTDVVSSVDVDAEYQGGSTALMKFIGQNLKYPEICSELLITKLHLRLIIEKDGTVSLIQLRFRKDDEYCKEIEPQLMGWLDVMPKWIPARLNGETVACFHSIPISCIKFR